MCYSKVRLRRESVSMVLKILIADGTEGFRDRLRDVLAENYTVVCAEDGAQALELFQSMRPNLLIVDLELSQIDGMTLLRRVYAAGYQPAVIVLGRFVSDYAVDELIQMKVGYLLRKPCKVSVAAGHVEKLLRYQSLDVSPVHAAIVGILRDFGISSGYSGSKYLLSAIVRMAQDPSQFITKELYPSVGKDFNKSGEQVERSIRHAIGMGMENCDPFLWENSFGKEENGKLKKPKNGDFIIEMVKILKTKL